MKIVGFKHKEPDVPGIWRAEFTADSPLDARLLELILDVLCHEGRQKRVEIFNRLRDLSSDPSKYGFFVAREDRSDKS